MTKKDIVKILQDNNSVLRTSLKHISHAEHSARDSVLGRIEDNNEVILSLVEDEEIK